MDVVMDGLLIAGTLFAGVYCWVLAGRVRALKSLDSGLGGAIVTLTRQIELARATLDEARAGSRETRQDLGQLIARSDAAAAQLRLLLAAIEKSDTGISTGPSTAPTAFVAPTPPPAPPRSPAHSPASSPAHSPLVAPLDSLAARRREVPGPRLVPPPEAEPDAPAGGPAQEAVHPVPKPRRMPSLDGLLRRRAAPQDPAPAASSEADLIAALSALAAGGER